MVIVFGPDNRLVVGYEASREFVVAILALVSEAFLQPGCQLFPVTALRLRKSVFSLSQFMRMRNLFASGEGEQGMKTGINAYRTIATSRDRLWLRINAQAQIPARSALDDTATFEASCREVLGMEPDMAYPSGMWMRVPSGAVKGSGNGMLVSLLRWPLSLGFLANFL